MKREFIFTEKWADIVFENRNQSYGAYMLRKRLPRNILIGYLTALLFMGTVIFTGYQFSKISIEDIKGIIDQLPPSIIYEIKPLMPPVSPPEKKAEPKNPLSKPSSQNIIPVVIDSINVSEEKNKNVKLDIVSNSKDTSSTGNDMNNKNIGGTEVTETKEPIAPHSLAGVQKIPEFRGGESSMNKFIRKNVNYPHKYLSDGIGGVVFVSFVVDSSGNVTEVKAKNEIKGYPEFTSEALHAVSKMPRWIPGQQNGMNVPVIMVLPIKFSVQKDF